MSDPALEPTTSGSSPRIPRDRRVVAGLVWEMRAWQMIDDGRIETARECFHLALKCFALAGDSASVVRVVDSAFEELGIAQTDGEEQ